MSSGLRVRVLWDDTTVEDRVYLGRRALHIGDGERARAVAPGCFATAQRRGRGWRITVEPGVTVEAPGEAPSVIEKQTERLLVPPFRSLTLSGSSAKVELEVIELDREHTDRALYAWAAAAAILAFAASGSYRLVRQFGEGHDPQWGHTSQLSAIEATRIRVQVGPEGLGSTRPQTGHGTALSGTRDGRPQAVPKKTPPRKKIAQRIPQPHKDPTQPIEPKKTRQEQVDSAEQALLQADLRTAIDSFERAAERGPLDYDELNWLGLSHYLVGELSEAEKVWSDARQMNPNRADAINNLASVAKRRGRTEDELRLLQEALVVAPSDCHALNSLALAQAKAGNRADAMTTLGKSDQACGGNYAYTSIQRAAIEALAGNRTVALSSLEDGLKRVDTLLPIKEYEVWADLVGDQAFASLRSDGEFTALTSRYLPRAASQTQKL